MMKYVTGIAILSLLFWSCASDNVYLKHELKYEKGGDCNTSPAGLSVTANTIGERFVFGKCLDAGFKGEYTVTRHGDTVSVAFPKPGAVTAAYQLTLDINTRPEYRVLSVDGVTYAVHVSRY